MTHIPLFSIIVPIYNTEPYLRQCVDSILNQSFRDFQVILVDDGSPDGSGAICDEYARQDSRVQVVHKKNGGLVSARKAGLAESCGKYIVNVDSDDYIAPDHLERCAEVIEAYHPEVMLCGATRFFEQDSAQVRPLMPTGNYDGEKLEDIHRNLICGDDAIQRIQYGVCFAVTERARYAEYQFSVPESISRGEDLVVTTPLLANCQSVYVTDQCGYFYRNNPTSIMNTFRRNEIQQMKDVASYLRGIMDAAYYGKVDMYVATHYFDFLDRAMVFMNYREYRELVRETLDDELYSYLGRAKCRNNLTVQLIFALLRNRLFGALWILRKIKRRRE